MCQNDLLSLMESISRQRNNAVVTHIMAAPGLALTNETHQLRINVSSWKISFILKFSSKSIIGKQSHFRIYNIKYGVWINN